MNEFETYLTFDSDYIIKTGVCELPMRKLIGILKIKAEICCRVDRKSALCYIGKEEKTIGFMLMNKDFMQEKNRTRDLRADADKIIAESIRAVMPDSAVKKALKEITYEKNVPEITEKIATCGENCRFVKGRYTLIAAGKAAWQMAKTAVEILGEPKTGIVVTKYGHVKGEIPGVRCYEAGHPVPDENGFKATEEAIRAVSGLSGRDNVLFLVSGGASALFEAPAISGEELQEITQKLLACGADINEINTIRKHLSNVKGGRFAELAAPARVYSVILSDVCNDRPDIIASGPTVADPGTCADALRVVEKYGIGLSDEALEILSARETPKTLNNSEILITGSVRELVKAAEKNCRELGYETVVLSDCLDCEAKNAGKMLAEKVREACVKTEKSKRTFEAAEKNKEACTRKIAFIAGGETVVKITGTGLGGRNQELALSAADGISGLNAAVFSVGSDGTDGPTDAAGGFVDGTTAGRLAQMGISIADVLENNDSYHALEKTGGLIFTGPTGTNVNDVAVALAEIE